MSVARPPTPCPFCRELIHAEAVKCKHCQSELRTSAPKRAGLLRTYNTFRHGFLIGTLFSGAVLILLWLQFS